MTGEIRFSIQTQMGAKILSYARDAGICLFDIACEEDFLCVWINSRDEKAFRELLDKYCLFYKITSFRGMKRIKRALRARLVLIVGLASSILLLYLFSLRIWVIDVGGEYAYIRESAKAIGIFPGIRKKDVDVFSVSRELEALHLDFAHIGVKLSGVVLKITPVKADAGPEVFDISAGRDVVAVSSGIVESIDVFSGTAAVRPGDVVFEGDILIYGYERADKDGATTPVSARGEVIAKVWTEGTAEIPTEVVSSCQTGRTSRIYTLKTPVYEKVLSGENPFENSRIQTTEISIIGLFVPVKIQKTTCFELGYRYLSLDTDIVKKAAYFSSLSKARSLAPEGAKEVRHWTDFAAADGSGAVACRAVVEYRMDISHYKQGG